MRNTSRIVVTVVAVGLGACGEDQDLTALRKAVAEAKVPMKDTVATAEASMPNGRALTAMLRTDTPVYAIGTIGTDALHDVRIDTHDGHIVSALAAGTSSDSCESSISLAAAIDAAAARITGGTVTAAIPDDDVACAREIQVLDPSRLWEVKVAGDGSIISVEESDETDPED